MFIAGVVRWVGGEPPNAAGLKGLPIAAFAFAHLKVIVESGQCILGEAELELGAAPEMAEATSLPAWGFSVPKALAERLARNAG